MNPVASRWILATPDASNVEALRNGLGLRSATAAVLIRRGAVDPARAAAFLNPRLSDLGDPAGLRDIRKAVDRTVRAIESGERVCIYGDYDADGMTATALLFDFFGRVGLEVRTFVPDRALDGYGVNADRMRDLAADGVTLVITVDCGVRSHDEIAVARSLGTDVIVLDHHEPGDTLPDAAAVVNPHRADCTFPFKGLAAVGVAFYFAGAVRRELITLGRIAERAVDLKPLLDLVAVGTVADVVPLLGDNRVFAWAGLKILNDGPRVGLIALKAVAEVDGRPVTAGTIGYQLAPRLNATGRLSNPRASLDLLMSRDPEEAKRFADVLNRENEERRRVEQDVMARAIEQVEAAGGPKHRALVVAGVGWHPGVVGIVASKLVEQYRRPTVVIGIEDGVGKGSGRSVRGWDIGRALESLSSLLQRCGGHPMAAGLALDASRIDEFAAAFGELADRTVPEEALIPSLEIDATVSLGDLDRGLADELTRLQPHGMGNPEPTLAMMGVKLKETRRVGRDGSHVQVTFEDGGRTIGGIWFGGADAAPAPGSVVDVAFALGIDDRTGGTRLKVKGMRLP